jgi:hypothetical protein
MTGWMQCSLLKQAVGEGAIALSKPAKSKQPTLPIDFGWHGAKRAFAHPTDPLLGNRSSSE